MSLPLRIDRIGTLGVQLRPSGSSPAFAAQNRSYRLVGHALHVPQLQNPVRQGKLGFGIGVGEQPSGAKDQRESDETRVQPGVVDEANLIPFSGIGSGGPTLSAP